MGARCYDCGFYVFDEQCLRCDLGAAHDEKRDLQRKLLGLVPPYLYEQPWREGITALIREAEEQAQSWETVMGSELEGSYEQGRAAGSVKAYERMARLLRELL